MTRPGRAPRGAFTLVEVLITLVTASIVIGGFLTLFEGMVATDQMSHRALELFFLKQFAGTKIRERLDRATKIRAPNIVSESSSKIETVITYNRIYYDDASSSAARFKANYTSMYSLTGTIFFTRTSSNVWVLERQPVEGTSTDPPPAGDNHNNENLLAGYMGEASKATWRSGSTDSQERTFAWDFINTHFDVATSTLKGTPEVLAGKVHLEVVGDNVDGFIVDSKTGPFARGRNGLSDEDYLYGADFQIVFRPLDRLRLY